MAGLNASNEGVNEANEWFQLIAKGFQDFEINCFLK